MEGYGVDLFSILHVVLQTQISDPLGFRGMLEEIEKPKSHLAAHFLVKTEGQGAKSNHRDAFKASVHVKIAYISLANAGALAKPNSRGVGKYSLPSFGGKCYKVTWQKVWMYYFITGRI